MPAFDIVAHLFDKEGRYVVHLQRAFSFPAGYFILLAALLDLFDFLLIQVDFCLERLNLCHVFAVNPELTLGAAHDLLRFHRIHYESPPRY